MDGTFLLDDLVRIEVLVASDVVFAGWCLLAAVVMGCSRRVGLLSTGVLLALRAGVELRYLVGILAPPSGVPAGPSRFEGLFVGAIVIGGWVILAFWQIAFARWLLRRLGDAR